MRSGEEGQPGSARSARQGGSGRRTLPRARFTKAAGRAGAVSSPPMRRLLRWSFNLAALVSALLLLGVCVLWVRSYRPGERHAPWPGHLPLTWRGQSWQAEVDRGRFAFTNRPQLVRERRDHLERFSRERERFSTLLAELAEARRVTTSPDAAAAGTQKQPVLQEEQVEQEMDLAMKRGTAIVQEACTPLCLRSLPAALPASLFAVVPAGWMVVAWRASRSGTRTRSGLCPGCGYDLCANPGRCPECGTTPARA